MYSAFGQYQNNELNVGANYHYIASGSSGTAATVDKIQNFTLGASYDFKVVKVSGVYSWNEIDYTLSTKTNAVLNNFLIGATVPFGKWSAKASYVYSDGKQFGDSQQLALGLNYDFSKRTDLYTAYSFINNDGARLSAVNDASNNGTYAAGGGYPTAGVFQQGFQVGVRHRF
jgi:predicted porin